NVTGAGGLIGARQAKDAAADGQSVLLFHTAMLENTASGLADFSWRDFELAGISGREPGGILVVKADAPWQSMSDLIDATKEDPGAFGLTPNTGATTYLVGALLNNTGAGFNFVDVGGSADRLAAVLGGNVDVSQNPLGQVKPYFDNRELRGLGSLSEARTAALPDAPTIAEQGYDVAFQYSYFYLFPKGTAQEVGDQVFDPTA
ncbi:tripartite tricarboxylate transporter substrate-binding protein, partial [Puniceibacterium confluentis]|uniref:tripartite tricarboxylate transporter substrate-binding protein n=1 Tax=Puniceibacterium confluentis TaxID=1958944 RepID=UPI00356312D8